MIGVNVKSLGVVDMQIEVQKQKIDHRTIVRSYFSQLQKLLLHVINPPSKTLAGYYSRVINFKERNNISWETYQQFVDFVFTHLVGRKRFDATSFGIICSNKVFYLFQLYNIQQERITPPTFEQLLEEWEKQVKELGL